MNSRQPLVSIVIPAFNHARFLREAIDSVLNQTWPAIELIVINDGSTDGTEDVLRAYPPGRFHWETQPNCGQSTTLNRGWEMSRGEVLSYLSADDLLQPHAVSRSVEQLLSSSAIAAVYSDFMLIGNASQAVRQVRVRDFSYYDLLVKGICQPGPGAFFRREAYEQAGGWDAALRQIPDFDFWLRVGLVGEIQRIPEVLSGFRVHEESQTYASPPADRCHEPVLVTTRCFERDDLPEGIAGYRSLAVSNACLTAAAMHWRGARYRESLGLLARACLLSPGSLLRPHAGHLLLHSLFSRTRHRLLSIRHRRRQFHTAPPTEPPDHQKHSAA